MKQFIFTLLLSFLFCLAGSSQTTNLVDVIINSGSSISNIESSYTIEKWSNNTKLVSIQLTNSGTKTELIKSIKINLLNTPTLGSKTKLLYGGSCMGRSYMQQRTCTDSTTTTETVFLAKTDKSSCSKLAS